MSILKLKKKTKEEVSPEEIQQKRREKTAQQWMPISNIEGKITYRKDERIVGSLRVQPVNIDLLSDREKKRKIDSLAEELNGISDEFNIFCIGRQVDLNNYLGWLQEKAKMEQDFVRKQVLKGYIKQASYMAASGETTERRFYIIISKKYENNKSEEDLISQLEELNIKLSQAELESYICQDDELMDLYSLFTNPVQAAFEKTEMRYDLPSLLEY